MNQCAVCGREYPAENRFCGVDGTALVAANPTPGGGAQSAFEQLARNARLGNGARPQLDALWGVAYKLPSWLFLVRGDNMLPIACPVNGRTAVVAFTDHAAAQAFMTQQRYGPEDDISVMLLSVERASEMLLSLRARGVELVQFNYAGEGFNLPLENLPAVYQYFNGRELPCVQDAELRRAGERFDAELAEFERNKET
ncbi:MAG TPA: hypothetical protein VE775_02805 [Pyrinomonadaceae bacterium]|nr:hypothetical protein [Pyrinomonadaceae bacterium]